MHDSAGTLDFLYVRRTKNLGLVELLVMVTRTGSAYLVISKFSDYLQNYMMPLEQCGHKVVRSPATITWLDEDRFHVAVSRGTWLDYFLLLSKTLSAFCFRFCRLLKQNVSQCTRYQVSKFQNFRGIGSLLLVVMFTDTQFVWQKGTNPQNELFIKG